MGVSWFLGKNPCVRIVIPFMLGIIFCHYCNTPLVVSLSALAVLLPINITLYKRKLRYTQGWLTGIFMFPCFFLLGSIVLSVSQKGDIQLNPNQCEYRACVLATPKEGEKTCKVDLLIESANIFGTWHNYHARVSGTIMNDSLSSMLKAGQTIEFDARINPLDAPKNPFGFDYSEYLQMNGVQGSIFLNSGEWKITEETVKGIKQYALNMRLTLVRLLESTGLDGNELGLASTLVLGYKDNIDAEIKQAYMDAGAMHVLAVSGMHVGIVCTMLEILMKILGGCRLIPVKRGLVISMLWGYAFLTGLSPSVMRATVMFTCVMFGKLLERNISTYNSLAVSAIILLLINPTELFQASFQLSYVAVIGIVFFQPHIVNLLKISKKRKALCYLWKLTAVSVSAQIATFPFCLYYFERTPVYFWLSNLVVSPGAGIMMILTTILLIVSKISFLSNIVGFVTMWAAKSMNFMVMSIANLPCSTIENTYITVFQAAAIVAIIICATVWLATKKHNWLISSLFFTLVFVIPITVNRLNNLNNRAICVYYSPKNPIIQFVNGRHSYWANSLNFGKKINPMVKGGNIHWGTSRFESVMTNDSSGDKQMLMDNGFFVFDSVSGLLLTDTTKRFSIKEPMTLDYLIVTGEPKIKARQMPKNLIFENVVIDASVKPWTAKYWERRYENCHVYNVKKLGAYICRLDGE